MVQEHSQAQPLDEANRHQLHEVRAFYAVPLGAMLMFSTFVYFGYRNRFHPTVHKRLMWFAAMSASCCFSSASS